MSLPDERTRLREPPLRDRTRDARLTAAFGTIPLLCMLAVAFGVSLAGLMDESLECDRDRSRFYNAFFVVGTAAIVSTSGCAVVYMIFVRTIFASTVYASRARAACLVNILLSFFWMVITLILRVAVLSSAPCSIVEIAATLALFASLAALAAPIYVIVVLHSL